ncbi:MAG: MarR family transcriptional regulator [Candidatus Yanofskybacteria bacterium]|nr:MarR family transcriptional regulator [Candidatus Yanofskybacteria bacterium]
MTSTRNAIERYAIRAVVALAAASSQSEEPEVTIQMREDAAHLMTLCIAGDTVLRAEGRQWCDDTTGFLQRWRTHGVLSEQAALSAATAVLRLRLVLARSDGVTIASEKKVQEKKVIASPVVKRPQPQPEVEGSQKRVLAYIFEHPAVRTGTLVAALTPSISSRTVKRCVKELVASGLIRRAELPDGGVAYTAN